MNPDSTASNSAPGGRCTSLLKLAIVVAVVSAVFSVAAPIVQQQLIARRAREVGQQLLAFKHLFQEHALRTGGWPAATNAPAEIPSGMDALLKNTPWTHSTPIGGRYTWDLNTLHRGHYYTAAISIRPVDADPVSLSREQLLAIDRQIDDGNLQTGRFLLGFHHFPLFVLEP